MSHMQNLWRIATETAAPQPGTIEKPGRCAAGPATKNDGLPYGGSSFSFVSMPVRGHDNTIEKTAGQTKVCHTRKAQAEACATADRRFFITVRGPRAHAGRPQKTIEPLSAKARILEELT